jgi:hypothetical protein
MSRDLVQQKEAKAYSAEVIDTNVFGNPTDRKNEKE